MLESILAAIGVTLLLWVLYRGIKGNKDAFSKANLSQSMMTLGVLALLLIGIISFAVVLLR